MKPTPPKTILIAGNMAGGQYTSTTIGTLGDGLQTLGHAPNYIAIDRASSPPTLQRLCPGTIHIQPDDGEGAAFEAAYESSADIAIIDCPACYADQLANPESLGPLAKGSTRIVVGIVVNPQSDHSIECGIGFADAFSSIADEYLVLTVTDGWDNSRNLLLETKMGKLLIELAKGRMIKFPQYSEVMRRDHNARPAVPSAHISQAANEITASP